MIYKFNFSCDETHIDVLDFINKGYGIGFDKWKGKVVNLYITKNNQNHITLLSPDHKRTASIFKTDVIYRLTFDYNTKTIPGNQIYIPAQTNVVYESYIHPLDEKHIFPHLPNVVITDIQITDYDNGYAAYHYRNEKDLVLDLLLGRIPNHIKPVSQYTQDIYSHTQEIAEKYLEQRNKETVDYMVSLINQLNT